jgi:2-desacetyl-2-hydroxyethyl bacteriochlorophyllide A dehydrogenase
MNDLREMRAAVYRERGVLEVEARPVPRPSDDEVLIRVSHCGVCGTDLHFVMDGWGRPGSIGGHEYSGTIAAVGADVVGWCVGDAVVAGADVGCGRCRFCRSHRVSLCEEQGDTAMAEYVGAFAEYKVAPAAQLHRIPDSLSLREAAIAEPLAVSLHGITQSGVEPGQRVLITGAGPVGMFTLAALCAQGVDAVTVSEPSEVRRDLALRVGAVAALAPESLESPAMPFLRVAEPYDVAFECSGKAVAIESALAQLGKGGTLCLLGTGAERPRLDAMRVLLNELVLTGAYTYDENGLGNALELIASGRLPTDLLIAEADVGLDDLLAAMEQLVAGAVGGKVLVAPN